jgi:hypothetical protein
MSSVRSISRIEPGQFALIMGATYLLIGIIMAVLIFAFASFIPSAAGLGMMTGGVTIIVIPIIYGVIGFVCGLIGAVIYNLVAGTVGGIKVTVTE